MNVKLSSSQHSLTQPNIPSDSVAKAITSRWEHQSFCTTCQKPADRGHPFKLIIGTCWPFYWCQRNTIAVEQLSEDLAGRGDLSRHDGLPGCSEVGSKFPLQFIVVGLIKFLAIVELDQRLKQGTLTIVTFLNGLNERCSIPAGCNSGHLGTLSGVDGSLPGRVFSRRAQGCDQFLK